MAFPETITTPGWVWGIISSLFVSGTIAASGWMWSLQSANASQNEELAGHKAKIDFLLQTRIELNQKLDRILEKLEK